MLRMKQSQRTYVFLFGSVGACISVLFFFRFAAVAAGGSGNLWAEFSIFLVTGVLSVFAFLSLLLR